MGLPGGHAGRICLGFACSIMFLVVFGMLVAYNTEAESSKYAALSSTEHPLTITIPASDPESTIDFYKMLGFRSVPNLTGDLDVVSMEKKNTPYKLQICHNRLSEAGPLSGGVSGMTFRVDSLSRIVSELQAKGLSLDMESRTENDRRFASIKDPNGIVIKLTER